MRIRVQGGQPLNGTYTPGGNTNAAAACLAASLLTAVPVTLDNLPQTATLDALLELAGALGTQISGVHGGPREFVTEQITRRHLTPDVTGGLVGGILFAAPILTRRGYVRMEVDFPLNRVRTHLEALRDLKQDVNIINGAIEITAHRWETQEILLSQASVTATGMVMMLAAAQGRETIIRNAACEPHITALATMLRHMGAHVDGAGSNLLTIYGGQELTGTREHIPSDYVEAASVATMIALTGGRGQIAGVKRGELQMIARVFQRLGLTLDVDERETFIPRHEALTMSNREEDMDASIESSPWPSFPSDLIPAAAVIATQAQGTALLHEKMFNNRLLFIDKLNAMGAQIVLCDPHRAIVVGRTPLRGIYMDSPDVRAGLALLIAALVADGTSTIDNAEAVVNSFDGLLGKLQALGARIDIE